MDWQTKNSAGQGQVEYLRHQIDVLQKRVDELERSTKHNFKYMDDIFDLIGNKLYPIYYKVFPGALDADNWLERIVKSASKKPRS